MSIDSPPPEVKKTFAPSSGTSSATRVGQRLRRRRGEAVVGLVRRELAHLRGGCLGELAAAVADVAVPERCGDVEQRVARVVPDGRALAAHDRDPALAERAHVRHRVPERALGHVGDAIAVLSRVPWWLDEAPPDPEAEPLSRRAEADVAIVGGGYTGLWTALDAEAARAGAACHRARGRARRLRAERPERRLPRDLLVRAAARSARGSATTRRSSSPGRRRARSRPSRRSARTSGCAAAGCSRSRPRLRRTPRWRRRSGSRPSWACPRARSPVEPGDLAASSGAACGSPTRRPSSRRGSSARSARSALGAGVVLHERTRVDVDPRRRASPPPGGRLRAPEIVVATNAWTTGWRPARGRLTHFGSYVVLTEPVPELLAEIGWTGGEAIVDGRMFLHYFRTTADGRVVMGSGSGPIGRGGRIDARFFDDAPTVARAEQGLRRLLPGLAAARVERAWGGPVDVSSDQLPFFATVPGTRIHYGAGYSGNGVGPSWLGGQILASLVLGADDEWSRLPLSGSDAAAPAARAVRYVGRRARAPGDPVGRGGGRGRASAGRCSHAASLRSRASSGFGSGRGNAGSTRSPSRSAPRACTRSGTSSSPARATRRRRRRRRSAWRWRSGRRSPRPAGASRRAPGSAIAAQRRVRARLRPAARRGLRARAAVGLLPDRPRAGARARAARRRRSRSAPRRRGLRRSASARSAAGSCSSAAGGPTGPRRSSASSIAATIAGYTLIDNTGVTLADPLAYLEAVMVGPALVTAAVVAVPAGPAGAPGRLPAGDAPDRAADARAVRADAVRACGWRRRHPSPRSGRRASCSSPSSPRSMLKERVSRLAARRARPSSLSGSSCSPSRQLDSLSSTVDVYDTRRTGPGRGEGGRGSASSTSRARPHTRAWTTTRDQEAPCRRRLAARDRRGARALPPARPPDRRGPAGGSRGPPPWVPRGGWRRHRGRRGGNRRVLHRPLRRRRPRGDGRGAEGGRLPEAPLPRHRAPDARARQARGRGRLLRRGARAGRRADRRGRRAVDRRDCPGRSRRGRSASSRRP